MARIGTRAEGALTPVQVMAALHNDPNIDLTGHLLTPDANQWLTQYRSRQGSGASLGPSPQGTGFLSQYGIADPNGVRVSAGEATAPPTGASAAGGGAGLGASADLATSPEWLAYLNALGLEQNQFTADIDRQRALVGSEVGRQSALIDPQFAAGRGRIAAGQESRGVFRSGQTQTRLAENRRQEGVAQGNLQADSAQQLSGLESALANKLIDINSRKAQQELTMRQNGYV